MPVFVLSTVDGLHVPDIPLFDVVGRTGAAEPLHIGAGAENVGVTTGLTVTVNVVGVAHNPAAGVKVYVPVLVLSTVEGLHVPDIPLFDVDGRTGAADPLHIGAGVVNVGVTKGLTVTVIVTGVEHCPAEGVNVYVPDVVLFIVAGLHVPLIPFVDVGGSAGAADPLHIGAIGLKVGVILELTVTVAIVVVAHCPAAGVNV